PSKYGAPPKPVYATTPLASTPAGIPLRGCALLGTGGESPPTSRGGTMGVCEVCGNDYYLSCEVVAAGDRHVLDSFECAIQKLVPVCAHCGCKVIGHGIEDVAFPLVFSRPSRGQPDPWQLRARLWAFAWALQRGIARFCADS